MLTYNLEERKGPLYRRLYECLRDDIRRGRLKAGEKLPSKRNLAENLGVSTITVENAYDQLAGEGFISTLPKRGYFVAQLPETLEVQATRQAKLRISMPKAAAEGIRFDFSNPSAEPEGFPFSVWARLLRETISLKERELLQVPPCGGIRELREAIAEHLASFRGMAVDPRQIILGAGTEYLSGLLLQLLGRRRYCLENPGYRKIRQIYQSFGVETLLAGLDEQGLKVSELRAGGGEVVHLSPTHHFPLGVTMSVSRRYELLAWANEAEGRYIIEDDYDSEFRLRGKPLPTLQSLDAGGRVIYLNTFTRSLTPTIRVSYMVLPPKPANEFYERLSFYACTVSNLQQYTLAEFIARGYFEKHINRRRQLYARRRRKVAELLARTFAPGEVRLWENETGLHFLLELCTPLTDAEVKRRLAARGLAISAVSDYDMAPQPEDRHLFIFNYAAPDTGAVEEAVKVLRAEVWGGRKG